MVMWQFNRLPAPVKPEVRALYEEGQFFQILDIYNEYKVSPDFLTPCCSIQKVIEWTNWAIHNGEL